MSDDPIIPATRDDFVRNMLGSQALQIATLTVALNQARATIQTLTAQLEVVKKALEDIQVEQARAILAAPKE